MVNAEDAQEIVTDENTKKETHKLILNNRKLKLNARTSAKKSSIHLSFIMMKIIPVNLSSTFK